MAGISRVATMIFFVCLYVSVNAVVCPYKECTCSGSNIICSNLHQLTIPPLVSRNLTGPYNLHFKDNKINSIPAGCLPPHLIELELTNNPISTIDNSAFIDSASTLQTLIFSSVNFSRIPDALLQVTNLVHLAVIDCDMTDWNDNVMKHIGTTLLLLELDNVNLKIWPGWIQRFSQLTELKVVNSFINALPYDAFQTLASSLSSLSLYSNAFDFVPEALKNLNSLQKLYLNDNQITDVNQLSQIQSSLFSLSLSNNKISAANNLSHSLRQFANTLFDIEIHHNELTAIPDLSFLQGITSLDLSYNNIVATSPVSLPITLTSVDFDNNNLRSLPHNCSSLLFVSDFNVNSNLITEIHGVDFPPQVISVILAYNLIIEITDRSFPEDSTIEALNLNDNPLSRISEIAFTNLPRLNLLHMRNTKLTRLPMALASATNLENLDMSSTFGLVCTCEEKKLGSVIVSMNSVNVNGDCGLTSVYNFFVTLSRFCP